MAAFSFLASCILPLSVLVVLVPGSIVEVSFAVISVRGVDDDLLVGVFVNNKGVVLFCFAVDSNVAVLLKFALGIVVFVAACGNVVVLVSILLAVGKLAVLGKRTIKKKTFTPNL